MPGRKGFWKGLDPCPRFTVALCLPGLGRNFPFSIEQAVDTNVGLFRFQEGKRHCKYDRGKGTAAFPSSPAWLHSSPRLNGRISEGALLGREMLTAGTNAAVCLLDWRSHLSQGTEQEGDGKRGNAVPHHQGHLLSWRVCL